jgi:GntR family transcriptional regulator, gluconate operon transcriptional repressor
MQNYQPEPPESANMKATVEKLKRLSLPDEAAQMLRESIAAGKLAPGTRLVEADMAQQLGISRGTVREALRMLEGQGLVESIPGRGTYVARFSEQDVEEVYSLRSLLEQEAVRLLTSRATADDLVTMEQALTDMFEAASLGKAADLMDRDLKFHKLIWNLAGHRRLAHVLEDLSSQIQMYLAIDTQLYADLVAGIADHQGILDAIRAGSGELAAAKMAAHLKHAAEVVEEFAHRFATV